MLVLPKFIGTMATRNLVLTTPGSKLGATILFVANGRTWTVDDAVASIRSSLELWPTLVEICYFQKTRQGLPMVQLS